MASLDSRLAAGESREEIRDFVGMYFRRVDSVLGSGVVDPYVVLDGEILAANPWEWDAEYDYASAPWYGQARSAEGASYSRTCTRAPSTAGRWSPPRRAARRTAP